MPARLFDEEFLRKLERLSLTARRIRTGVSRGENLTISRGASLDFADFRLYQPGDDFRYLDWNVYRRLNRLFLKVFTAEENLTVHILVDTSRSMAFGSPSKLWYAARLAAALGYLAIHNLDRVGVSAFAQGIEHSLPPLRQASHASTLFEYLGSLEPAGRTDFNGTLHDYAMQSRRPGMAILLTDLLDPGGYVEGLKALLYGRFDVLLLHVMDEQEITPELHGPYRLVDGETLEETELDLGSEMAIDYRRELERFFAEIEDFSLSNGIEYLRTTTRIPFEDVVLDYLRRGVFVH